MAGPYMVIQDGMPILRGLSLPEATREADKRARKYEGHVSGTSNRVPAYDIVRDTHLESEHNANYRWLKENK